MNKIIVFSIFLVLLSCSKSIRTEQLTELITKKYNINTKLWKINSLVVIKEKSYNKTDIDIFDIKLTLILNDNCYNIQTGDNYLINYLREKVSNYKIYEKDVCLTESEILKLYNEEIDKKRQMIGTIVCQDSVATKIYNSVFNKEDCSIKSVYGEEDFLSDKKDLLNDMILKRKYLKKYNKGHREKIETNIQVEYDQEKDLWHEVL